MSYICNIPYIICIYIYSYLWSLSGHLLHGSERYQMVGPPESERQGCASSLFRMGGRSSRETWGSEPENHRSPGWVHWETRNLAICQWSASPVISWEMTRDFCGVFVDTAMKDLKGLKLPGSLLNGSKLQRYTFVNQPRTQGLREPRNTVEERHRIQVDELTKRRSQGYQCRDPADWDWEVTELV